MKLFGLLPEEDFETLSKSTNELIKEIGDANFIIVGASGFLGRWLSTYFAYMQMHGQFPGTVTLVLRDISKVTEIRNMKQSPLPRVIQIDSLEVESFSHLNLDRVVIFFAASSTSSTSLKGEETGSEATSLAEKVISLLPRRHITFVHLSSGGIYESSARQLQGIPRNYRLQNHGENAYINEKLTLENWSQKQNTLGRLVSRNPRLFSFYGPGLQLERHFAVGEFMEKARKGLPIQIRGNPKNIRSYLYPTDAIQQLLLQSQLSEPSYQQVGSAIPMTILEVGQVIAKNYGVPLEITKDHSLETDNYLPLDVPIETERNFDLGIKLWSRWLNNPSIDNLFN